MDVWVGSKARFRRRQDGTFNLPAIVKRARERLLLLLEQQQELNRRAAQDDQDAALEEETEAKLRKLLPSSLPLSMQCSAQLGVTLTLGPTTPARAEQVLRWLDRMPLAEVCRGQVWRHRAQGFTSEVTEVQDNGYAVLHSGQGPDLPILQRELVERWELVT